MELTSLKYRNFPNKVNSLQCLIFGISIIQFNQQMSKKNKYALLDKDQKRDRDQSDMIQLMDWQLIQSKAAQQQKSKAADSNYIKFQDNEQMENQRKPVPTNQQKVQPQQSTLQINQKKVVPNNLPTNSQIPPVYPTYSTNPNPHVIVMNGSAFRKETVNIQRRAAKVPQMKVACDFCTFQQNVPGNTQVYICCCCNNMNQCFPLYGLFICGSCQGKVCYPYGTSDMIRCTRCGTVNRVPTQPKKNYSSEFGTKKQEKKETRDIEIHEQEYMQPVRPKQKEKEQEIFFEDFHVPENEYKYDDLK